MRAHRVGDGGLDRIGVRDEHDHAALVLRSEPVDRAHHAGLHLGEALTVREAERAGGPLHRAPLGQLHQLLEFGAGPIAELALQQSLVDLHLEAARRSDGGSGLAGTLERRGVDRVDRRERGDAFGGALGLLASDVGEVQTGRSPGEQLAGGGRLPVAHEQHERAPRCGRRCRRA